MGLSGPGMSRGCARKRRAGSLRPALMEALEPRLLLDADWTVLVYLDADNNLEGAGIDDVNEMEAVGSTGAVNVVVQFDRIDGFDSSNGNWTDTRRGRIVADGNPSAISSGLSSIGEANMGDPATLTEFIQWGVATYPAERYLLVLWDHGGGTDGVCWDDTNGDHLTVPEVGLAIADSGHSMDIVGFDACLMGMLEQAYEIRDHGDVMVASEQSIPWDGWSYDTFLADLSADPGQDAATLASSIITRYAESYGGDETLSSVDLNVVGAAPDQAAGALSDFVSLVMSDADMDDYNRLQQHRQDAPSFDLHPEYRDLGTFLEGAATDVDLAGPLATAAQTALDAYNAAVLDNHSGPGEGATGMSIYFPAIGAPPASDYMTGGMDLLADTQWDEFLEWWEVGPPPVVPGSVEGEIWSDANADGVRDPGEDPLPGWTAFLDMNDNGTLDRDASKTVRSMDVPKAIEDYETATSQALVRSASGVISDVNVTLNIDHTWDNDLEAYLISPSGRRILLFSRVGGSGDDFANTTLDDEAELPIESGVAPFSGSYRPVGDLSVFDGENPEGVWLLEVSDLAGLDQGWLNAWSLEFMLSEPSAVTDVDGEYLIEGVIPGDYRVREVVQPAWTQTFPAVGYHDVTVVSDATVSDVLFGNLDARPQAFDQAAAVDEDQSVDIALTATDDATAPGDLTWAIVVPPEHGTVTLVGGTATYTPADDYNGPDSFEFVAADDGNPAGSGEHVGTSDPATVTITVDPVNDPPTAIDQTLTADQATPIVFDLAGTDLETPPGDLQYAVSTPPAHGTLIVVDGTATYTSDAGYEGLDAFEFVVIDDGEPAGSHANPGDATSAPGVVTIGIARELVADDDADVEIPLGGGDWAEIRLKGPGAVTVYDLAYLGLPDSLDITRMVITGATDKTKLSVRSDRPLNVGEIEMGGGVMNRFDGRDVNLRGDLDAAGGIIEKVQLLSARDGMLRFGGLVGRSDEIDLRIEEAVDVSVESVRAIKKLQVGDWQDVDAAAETIRAPRVDKVKIDRDLGAGFVLNGAGESLGKAKIGGALRGDSQIAGDVGKLQLGSLRADFEVAGNLKKVKVDDVLAIMPPVDGEMGALDVGGETKVKASNMKIDFRDARLFTRDADAYSIERLRRYDDPTGWWEYDIAVDSGSSATPEQSSVIVKGNNVEHYRELETSFGCVTETWRSDENGSSLCRWLMDWHGDQQLWVAMRDPMMIGVDEVGMGASHVVSSDFLGRTTMDVRGINVTAEIAGTATMETTLLGHEQVTVATGTYLTVQGETELTMSGTVEFWYHGSFYYGQVEITQTQEWWAAPEVGVVRGATEVSVDVKTIGKMGMSHDTKITRTLTDFA